MREKAKEAIQFLATEIAAKPVQVQEQPQHTPSKPQPQQTQFNLPTSESRTSHNSFLSFIDFFQGYSPKQAETRVSPPTQQKTIPPPRAAPIR